MKTFRILLSTITALALLTLGVNAGQQPTTLNGGTNNVAAASTNTYGGSGVAFATANSSVLSLQATFSCNGTNAQAVTLVLDSSNDNANWQTSTLRWPITANGTNTVTAVTNLSVGGQQVTRAHLVENPNATVAVTNLTLTGWTKSGI